MDCGAWWAVVYGVAQSQTRLKQLRTSSSICKLENFVVVQHNAISVNLFLWVGPQAERPRFLGPLLRRTRGPDPSSKATLWVFGAQLSSQFNSHIHT